MLDIYAWRSASIGHIPPHCTVSLRNPCASKQRPMADLFAADYTPRTIWRLQRGEHVMEARLMPHAQYLAVVILVDGQARAAKEFEHQTDALRWADEQRMANAEAATGLRPL